MRCSWTVQRPLPAVSIWSLRQTCGLRYIPEEALHRFGTPRPAALALTGLMAACASAMAAFAGLGALFPASILAGLAFGEAPAVAS